MTERLRRTQLYDIHLKTAKITAFAGFAMPLYYQDISPEHLAVRNRVGVFDISHMGRVIVSGSDSEDFLNYVVTNDVSALSPNSAQYSVMCTEKGGIVDDFVVYRLESERFLIVFNASNREKDFAWFVRNKSGFTVGINDISDDVAMFAVQGPNAEKTLQKISSEDLGGVGRFKCCSSNLAGVPVFLARTGYTGEDGFEVVVWDASISHPAFAVKVWEAILEAGQEFNIVPCGLGARDTLRLEAGLCLYGNDIDETKTPLEAGLGFVVKLQKERFVGREALLKEKAQGSRSKRVGIMMIDQGIPREGFGVYSIDGKELGQLTSGTFSPLLRTGIGMGYVEISHSSKDTIVNVNVRGKMCKAKVSAFPLYDPDKYGYRRKVEFA